MTPQHGHVHLCAQVFDNSTDTCTFTTNCNNFVFFLNNLALITMSSSSQKSYKYHHNMVMYIFAPRCLTTAQTHAQPTSPYPANRSPVLRPMLRHMVSSTLSFNRLGEKDDCYGVTILQGVDFQNIVSVNFSLSIDPKDKVINLKIGCFRSED